MGRIGRRDFLSLAALAAGTAGVTGCATADAGRGEKMRSATYIPPSYKDLYPGIERFRDVATRTSGGALSYEAFHSGTLLGAGGLLPGLLAGSADTVFITSSYVTSSFPVLGATQMPFVTDSYSQYRRALDPDGALMGIVNEQLATKNVRILGGMPTSFEYIWTAGAPIRKPEDMAGLRIRVAGEIEGVTIKAFGGAPVFMSSSEVYQALQRGTIDGMMSYLGTVYARDLQRILRYGTATHFGAYTVDAYCRQDWYDNQPARIRDAMDTAGRAIYEQGTAHMLEVHEQKYLPAIRAGGVELVEPTPAEQTEFRKAVQPVYGHWRSMLGDDGLASTVLESIKKA